MKRRMKPFGGTDAMFKSLTNFRTRFSYLLKCCGVHDLHVT